MLLKDLIKDIEVVEITGNIHTTVNSVVSDSRQATAGSLFVAIRGLTTDGHLFINKAVALGSTAIICDEIPKDIHEHVCYVQVNDSAKTLGNIAANFYGHPSKKLEVIGVTGTNGKTTVVRLLYDVFTALGHSCGFISTTGNKTDGHIRETQHTTPDALTINKLLSEMVTAGCKYAFMEVSSHALVQHRTEAIQFRGAVFTNISHEHLDYHQSFKEYIRAKQLLFNDLGKNAFALTNLDDKNGLVIIQNTVAEKTTYSLRSMAKFKGRLLENSFNGLHIKIDNKDIWSRLSGRFNAYNIMAVYAIGKLLKQDTVELLSAISSCEPPEGRFDYFVSKHNITGIIDYAHTPDALENVLQNINEIKANNQQLITVVGCGGNRDKAKRPLMAAIAAKYSDKVLFTSDNPRFEDPEQIIDDMVKGLDLFQENQDNYIIIPNRKEAVKVACITAASGDIILVAGKGHEKYQEIKGKRIHFNDKKILHELLNR